MTVLNDVHPRLNEIAGGCQAMGELEEAA